MIINEIQFTGKGVAELVKRPLPEMTDESVLTRTFYTVVSQGTEKANLLDLPNTFAYGRWPKTEGYAGVGVVVKVGAKVKKVKKGDRVLVYHGTHADYSLVPESRVYLLPPDADELESVFCIIGAMGLGGLRKTALEIGESAMIFGLGLLGCFALQAARASGAYPLIAADLSASRRALGLKLGADIVLDPTLPDFKEKVLAATDGKGVNAIVEVTGAASALNEALDVAARQARIALNGCTRVSDCTVDFYRQVHCPGITLIGAHNSVRPKFDGHPHYWTNEDDVLALVKLNMGKRISVKEMINEVVSPKDCGRLYERLIKDKDFPLGVAFDWKKL